MARPAIKAAFVQQHTDKPVADIIAAGAREGVKLSKSYVTKVLTSLPRKRAAAPAAGGSIRTEFRKLVLRVGTEQAQAWLTAIPSAISV